MEVEVARVVVGSTVVVDDGVGDATDEENSEEMDEAMEESSAEVDVLAGAEEVEPGAELVVAVAGLVVDADMLLVVVGAAEVAGEEEEGEEVEAALARKRCGRKVTSGSEGQKSESAKAGRWSRDAGCSKVKVKVNCGTRATYRWRWCWRTSWLTSLVGRVRVEFAGSAAAAWPRRRAQCCCREVLGAGA